MKVWFSLIVLLILIAIPTFGASVSGLQFLFGVIIPYAAIAIFLIGFILRILNWAKSPVPFRITTTSGQQKSLSWVKQNKLENPVGFWGVVGRMALEVLFFRSLFRNTKTSLKEGPKLVYGGDKFLWIFSLIFHWSFLIIFIRHFKLFLEPVPALIPMMESLDGFFQVGLPIIFLTDALILAGLTFLVARRLFIGKIRYISLAADYFPLFLILSIAITGIMMRYFTKVDIIAVKELTAGLFSFHPAVPEGIGAIFFVHIFLVSILIMYFPFSKLMHMGGVFMSPTRNLANNSRIQRHINPWNPDVKLHTYEEWEDEFRDVMKAAGMPLEKE